MSCWPLLSSSKILPFYQNSSQDFWLSLRPKKKGETESFVWICNSHWGSLITVLQGLRWSLTVSKASAQRHEKAGGCRVDSYLFSFPPLAQAGGPFPNANSSIYTDGGNRFVSNNLGVMLNRYNSPKGGEIPVPTNLHQSVFHFCKNPGSWAQKRPQEMLPYSIQWIALPITALGWGARGGMGNVPPERNPLSWILNIKRIFLGEWSWGCGVLWRTFLWLERHM